MRESRPGRDNQGQAAAKTQPRTGHTPGRRLILPGAIRPAPGIRTPLREGYRVEVYRDSDLGIRIPVLTAAISADRLFPVFLDLLAPLGEDVDFILESSHDALPDREGTSPKPLTWERESIDLPVLTSTLLDYEDLLVHDGCTGVAVLNPDRELEVHFDEHKLLYLYGPKIGGFESILRSHGIFREDDLILVTESEHIHCTLDEYLDKFSELRHVIGIEDGVERAHW